MSIIDPRHALYGQTLRLVNVLASGKEAAAVCTVELRADVWRRISLNVTSLGHNQPFHYPLPLNLAVMRQLLEVFRRMEVQCQETPSDENREKRTLTSTASGKRRAMSFSPTTLAPPHSQATADDATTDCPRLLADDAPPRAGEGGAPC